MQAALVRLFEETYGRAPTVVTRAPGRIEFIGNHTDYNGGTVLGAAIDRGVWVAAGPAAAGRLRFFSQNAPEVVEVAAGSAPPQRLEGRNSWANYPLGVWAQFRLFGLKAPEGLDYCAMSDLPAGAGLSSSAAIELASALAFAELAGIRPDRETLVQLARRAENEFVGVPCGILDQGVSGFGREDHLVFIDCRGPTFATVPLPAGVHFWVFNTHTKHALVDGLYAARHRECMEAARALGVAQLVDATAAAVEAARGRLSPETYRRARHVVEEIARVAAVRTALQHGHLVEVGRALTASHRSSQTLFENSTEELDFLVDTLTAQPGVFGARLTGGGFGGAAMALTDGSFDASRAGIVRAAYADRFGTGPEALHLKTGPGAAVLS
jgi:galactokinase